MAQRRYSDIDEQKFEDTFSADLLTGVLLAVSVFSKIAFFPVYFLILFYRNTMAMASDKYLSTMIRRYMKKKGFQKISTREIAELLNKKGIYCLSKSDIQFVLKVMHRSTEKGEEVPNMFKCILSCFYRDNNCYLSLGIGQ